MRPPLTRADLDLMRCAAPDCGCGGELWFHSACHPEIPAWAVYDDGMITLRCAECDTAIAEIVVAS